MRCILLVHLINVSIEYDKYYGKSISRLGHRTSRGVIEMHEDYTETKIGDFLKSESGLAHPTVRYCEEVQTRRD